MGNTIANNVADTLVKKQKDLQFEMMQKQMDMQMRMGERQRRMMIAQILSQQRETFWWLAGTYATILTGTATFARVKGGVPKALFAPLALYGVVVAYQWDMAYGTKMERVNKIMSDILTKEKEEHWFTPLMPSEKDVSTIRKW